MKILPLCEPYWHSFLTMTDHTLIVCLNKPSLKEKKKMAQLPAAVLA